MAAIITTPTPGLTICGAIQTFTWTASPGAQIYQLWVGSAPNTMDLAASGYVTDTQATIYNLPANGSIIYITVYEFNGSAWIHNADYPFLNLPTKVTAFTRSATVLTFQRNPLRPQQSRSMVQANVASAGAERIGQPYYAKNDLIDLHWPGMSTADKDSLLAFWTTTARGMGRSFTYTDSHGPDLLVRFAKPTRPEIKEKAYGSWAVKLQLRVI